MPNSHKIIKTEDLIRMRAEGSLSRKELDLLDRRMELEVEMNRADDYRKNFKKNCVVYDCRNPLPEFGLTDWQHYKQYGNYCQKCSTRIGKYGARVGTKVSVSEVLQALKSK